MTPPAGRPGTLRFAPSIQAHLLALVLGVTLPLLVFSAALGWRYAVGERAQIEADAANSAREIAAGIDILLANAVSTAEVLAGSEALASGDLQAFHERAIEAARITGGNVTVRDADSRQILNSNIPWGQPLPNRTSLAQQDAEAARTGRPVVSDGYWGIADNKYHFAVVLPLPPRDGNPARFLSLSVPAARAQRVLEGVVTLPPQMRAGVVDRSGNFLARSPEPERWIGRPAALLPELATADGNATGPGTDGAPTRFFVRHSAVAGWRVAAALPEAVLWAPLQQTLWTMGIAAAAALVIALGTALLGTWRIGGAVRALSAAGDALRRDVPFSAPASRVREVNQVGAALVDAVDAHHARDAALRDSEALLRVSEERLRRIIEAAQDHAIVTFDLRGRIASWSRGAESLFGWAEHEVLGEDAGLIFTSEDRRAGIPEAEMQAVRDDGRTTHERWQVRRDRSRFWAAGSVVAMRDAAGKLDGYLKVCRDETARKEAEDQLRASEERFRTLAATMPALIFLTDANGANTYTNTVFQQFTGRTADALLGDGWVDTLHPDDRARAAATWAKAWQTGTTYNAEYRFHRHGDGYRAHLVRGTPVRDAQGRIVQWVGVSTDVQDVTDARDALSALNAGLEARVAERTADLASALERLRAEAKERASAEAQVRQLQKMEAVGQLTGGIAHDFNNMLAIVIGSLDIAKRRLEAGGDPARVLRGIENADEGAKRAAQLTARLLAFSRQQPLAPEAVDANKLVAGMSELLRRTIGENVRVETVLAGGLWRSHADAGQLENAVLNLCVNARDAMPGGGRLTIETANCHLDEQYANAHDEVAPGQYVMIAVTDTGTGMTSEVAERAFDPFYTTKGVNKGTGLGLSQVYGFIKQSGGHVKIYSEPGQGTTVKIYLPRHFGPVQADDVERPVLAELPRAAAGETILVVEDEAGVRHMAIDALRDLGYTVVPAASGNQALGMLAVQPRVDLLFTDIVMPDMNGRILADEALRRRPDLHVLFTTGYTRNAVVHNGTLDPGVAFLPKPFTIGQLAQKVRAVLDGDGANRRA